MTTETTVEAVATEIVSTTVEAVEAAAPAAEVLSIAPATLAMVGGLKASLADAAAALAVDGKAGTLTIALRDNGPKINGTLVVVEGKVGDAGDTFGAVNSGNRRPYGVHTVLGTVEYSFGADDAVSLKVQAGAMLSIDMASFKAPVFQRA
jgi:hypothetical protein